MTNSEGNSFTRAYRGLVIGENALASLFLLIVRLYWGWLLIITGFGKWMHINETAKYFASLNIPVPVFMAGFVGAIEFVGGISLFLGLWARIFTIPLVILFIVAMATTAEAPSNILANATFFTRQEPFLYLIASLIVLFFGSGYISFDYLIERKVYGRGL